jgi:hypothetical protein
MQDFFRGQLLSKKSSADSISASTSSAAASSILESTANLSSLFYIRTKSTKKRKNKKTKKQTGKKKGWDSVVPVVLNDKNMTYGQIAITVTQTVTIVSDIQNSTVYSIHIYIHVYV